MMSVAGFLLCADKGGLSATRKFLHVIAAFLLAPGRCNAEGRSVFWTATCMVNLYPPAGALTLGGKLALSYRFMMPFELHPLRLVSS